MISQSRREHSEALGVQAEAKFIAACHARGYLCQRSTVKENATQHIDYYVTRPSGIITVDVKGNNLINCIWVEFKNVKGNDGWLYGVADYIAFDIEQLECFVVVSREELLKLCLKIVTMEYTDKNNALHKLYRRAGRQDSISKLVLNDLINLKSFTILNYAEGQKRTS